MSGVYINCVCRSDFCSEVFFYLFINFVLGGERGVFSFLILPFDHFSLISFFLIDIYMCVFQL